MFQQAKQLATRSALLTLAAMLGTWMIAPAAGAAQAPIPPPNGDPDYVCYKYGQPAPAPIPEQPPAPPAPIPPPTTAPKPAPVNPAEQPKSATPVCPERDSTASKANAAVTAATTQVLQYQDGFPDVSDYYYDSGWVPVEAGASYLFPHRFGSVPTYVTVQQCGRLDSANQSCAGEVVIAGEHGYQDGMTLINPIAVTSTEDAIKVVMGNFWAWGTWNAQNGWQCPGDADNNCNTAYYRVIAMK